jgi:hypothetical protein
MRRMAVLATVALGVAACNDQRIPTNPVAPFTEPAAPLLEISSQPGTRPMDLLSLSSSSVSTMQESGLRPMVTETGSVSASVDGVGTLQTSGVILVDKPAGATVRGAYVAATSRGFSGTQLNNGEIRIDGVGVDWDVSEVGPISNWNHWAEVTSIVSEKLDAAPAGLVSFTISQDRPFVSEGVILGVVFNDPNRSGDNTVIFMFGRQSVGGDEFFINLADPIDADDPDLRLTMGLGISFGFQSPTVTDQVNIIDVNGERLTSSAGGQDDAQGTVDNGALLTVGGVGDSPTNPPPFSAPTDFDFDDELYDLTSFVKNGDTQIRVFTENPSFDDNIFFAWLDVTGRAAVNDDPPPPPPPPPPPSDDCEACSPGFWSQNGVRTGAYPAGYAPEHMVSSVFPEAGGYLGEATLLQALEGYPQNRVRRDQLNGAKEILLRQAVAAVLNEAKFGAAYPAENVASIQAAVAAALASGDRAAILALAEKYDLWNNNLKMDPATGELVSLGSCPL